MGRAKGGRAGQARIALLAVRRHAHGNVSAAAAGHSAVLCQGLQHEAGAERDAAGCTQIAWLSDA